MHQCIYNSSDGNALALGITVVTKKKQFAEVNIEDFHHIKLVFNLQKGSSAHFSELGRN